jgi:hypothetical protein
MVAVMGAEPKIVAGIVISMVMTTSPQGIGAHILARKVIALIQTAIKKLKRTILKPTCRATASSQAGAATIVCPRLTIAVGGGDDSDGQRLRSQTREDGA